MKRKSALLCALSLTALCAHAADLSLSLKTSLIYEKGESSTAAAPALELGLSAAQKLGEGEAYARIGLFSGAFVGETIGLKASAGYDFDFGGAWRPGLGLTSTVDFGSRLIVRSGAASLPTSPMPYFGIELDPLRFDVGDCTVSALDAGLSLAATQGPKIWRYELGLLRLERRLGGTPAIGAGTTGAAGSALGLSLKSTYGLSYDLFQSLPGGLSYLSLDTALGWRDMELCLGATSLAHDPGHFASQWLTSASISYAPTIGRWNPSLGLGWLYANAGLEYPGGITNYYLATGETSSFFLSMKPLRFLVPLSPTADAVLSCLELRYSPLFPTMIAEHSEPGTNIISADLIRVGVQTRL